jgi:hypothetical protein
MLGEEMWSYKFKGVDEPTLKGEFFFFLAP